MRIRTVARNRKLVCEPLEQRALMSAGGAKVVGRPVAALLERLDKPRTNVSSPGETAILNAYFGGPGHEFIALIENEIRNPMTVIGEFESGALHADTIPGFTVKSPPNLQSGYTGPKHDSYALNAAGAVLLKRKQIELGAIMRGPFTTSPFVTDVVFAINRGDGAHLGPVYPSRPGITPDALVTVTVGSDGQNNSATITDLTTGTTEPISVPIKVSGPTVRILVPESLLPSKGFSVNKYQFAAWTESEANAPITDVGSFIQEDAMTLIGVESNLSATF
jgi:hypothetical protein